MLVVILVVILTIILNIYMKTTIPKKPEFATGTTKFEFFKNFHVFWCSERSQRPPECISHFL